MDKTYKVYWSQTALDELSNIIAFPPDIKERIYLDSFPRLSFMPTLTAKQIKSGFLEGYWTRLGLYQVILVFEVDEQDSVGLMVLNIKGKMFIGNGNKLI